MPAESESEQCRKLFIGGLTLATTDEMLKEFYSQWGDVVDHVVMRDSQTKRSRGFGFVTYAAVEMLEASMSNRPHIIDGRQVDPKRAIAREAMPPDSASSSSRREPNKRLFVAGIKDDHTEEGIHEYFSNYGTVMNVEIILDKQTGDRRGFAFVTFEDYDPVDKCAIQKTHMIDGKRCDVKKAEPAGSGRSLQMDRDRSNRAAFRGSRGAFSRGGRPDAWSSGGGGWGNPAAGYGGSPWTSGPPGGYGAYGGGQPAPTGWGQPTQQGYVSYPQQQPQAQGAFSQWGGQPLAQQQPQAAWPGYGGQPSAGQSWGSNAY